MAEEKKRISPLLVAGIGAGAAIGTGVAIYLLTRAKAPSIPPPGGAILYGMVTDIDTGQPIEGLKISLDGLVTYTGSNGAYAFDGVEPGTYTVIFEMEGYEPITRPSVLVEGNNELNVQMVPVGVPPGVPPGEAVVYGFVTDALTGAPIPQVMVTLDGLVRYTASEGQYEIRDIAADQAYRLKFSKDGYQPLTLDIVPSAGFNEVSPTLMPIIPTKPELVYARPAEAQIPSGATGHINYKVGIPEIPKGYALIFLFHLEGVYCWTPYGCANLDFRAGAKGYYEGSAPWYVKYMTDHFKFANIPPGTYRLLSTCQLYWLESEEYQAPVVKTYWKNLDTGEKIVVV